MMNIVEAQQQVCARYGAIWMSANSELKVGISQNVRSGVLPLNGLRHPPSGDTTGWYIWGGGEPSSSSDFFVPLHVSHLEEWCPEVLRFLGLPPGWRFLTATGHEDVWQDLALLDV